MTLQESNSDDPGVHGGADEDSGDTNLAIASAVRKHRKRRRLSQTELGRRMKAQGHPWHQMTVARTESGDRPLRLDEAIALAGIFDVSVSDLFTNRTLDDPEYEALREAVKAQESSLMAYTAMLGRAEAALQQLHNEAMRARERVDEAEMIYIQAVQRLQDAEKEVEDTRQSVRVSRTRFEELRSELEALRARRQQRALIESLKPGDHVNVTINNVEPAATRYVQQDKGIFYELLTIDGRVAMRGGPFKDTQTAKAAVDHLLKKHATRQSEQPDASEKGEQG